MWIRGTMLRRSTHQLMFKEYGNALAVDYPSTEYPQDLFDSIVMPSLRRNYDKARIDNWQLAKQTTIDFEVKTGPVMPVLNHVNGERHVEGDYDENWVQLECPHCEAGIAFAPITEWRHHFGWYVAIEVPDDQKEDVANNALP